MHGKQPQKIHQTGQEVARTVLKDTMISAAIVIYNEQEIIEDVIMDLHGILDAHYTFYELIVVDLNSTDQTIEKIVQLQKKLPHIRILVLSRHYPMEIAYAAALENSIGDYVVLLDVRYDPPAMIPQIIGQAMSGNDVVIGMRSDRRDLNYVQRRLIGVYYWVTSLALGYPLSPFASYYRVYSRRAVNSIVKIKSKSRYLKYFSAMMGFRQTEFNYQRIDRKPGQPINRGFYQSLSLAIDILVSNSSRPLRFAALLGLVAGMLNLLFLVYVFVVLLVQKHVAQGWASTSVMSASMFFILFMILAVMSEYIARILNESKEQPLYFLAEEYDSSDNSRAKERLNVV